MDAPVTRLFLVLLTFCLACAERDRPLPFGAAEPVALSVAVLSPEFNTVAVAGRPITVRVRASEPTGRLEGLGYVARHRGATVDSAAVYFPARSDTTHVFVLRLPADLPANAHLDIFGLAFGPQTAQSVSEPRVILVVRCTEQAIWCN
ncbi:MAG TPA: hypothetical protein VKZ58_10295 [Longimicrobiales bacterium]|nr:hypothetical protein [Longimicrobiales bacterium]